MLNPNNFGILLLESSEKLFFFVFASNQNNEKSAIIDNKKVLSITFAGLLTFEMMNLSFKVQERLSW
jgi:hypothetical protein